MEILAAPPQQAVGSFTPQLAVRKVSCAVEHPLFYPPPHLPCALQPLLMLLLLLYMAHAGLASAEEQL